MFFNSTSTTFIPQGSVCASTIHRQLSFQRGCSDGPPALSLADATEEAVRTVLAYVDA
jgi:hypothetical protein